MTNRVLDQRLEGKERKNHVEHFGCYLKADVQSLPESRAFEGQVTIDVAQLVGKQGELTRRSERVPREVRELEDQFSGPRRIGSNKRCDRVERVVDEMRTDLCAQGTHFGSIQQALDASRSASSI